MKTKQSGIAPLIIVAIIVVATVAVGVGVYVATRGGGTGGGGGNIASATSLSFNTEGTVQGQSFSGTIKIKDIGTSGMKLRLEGTTAGQETIAIINGLQQKCWMSFNGQWSDMSGMFSSLWSTWNTQIEGYMDNLSSWNGEGTWTSPDGTYTISNLQVNPVLDDSLFVH